MLPPKLPPKNGIRKFIRRYFDLLKTTKKPLFTGFVKVGLTVCETQRAVMKGSKKSLSLRKAKAQSFGKQMVAFFVYWSTPIFTPTFWGQRIHSRQFICGHGLVPYRFVNQCCQDLDRLSADSYFVSPRKKVSPMVEESKIECKFRAFCSDAVVVGSSGKLAAEVADGIIIECDSQFQFNGHASLAVTKIPDTFTQNGIHHRSNLILRTPYGIVVSHLQYFLIAVSISSRCAMNEV